MGIEPGFFTFRAQSKHGKICATRNEFFKIALMRGKKFRQIEVMQFSLTPLASAQF